MLSALDNTDVRSVGDWVGDVVVGVCVCSDAADSVFLFSLWGRDQREEWHGCEVRGTGSGGETGDWMAALLEG